MSEEESGDADRGQHDARPPDLQRPARPMLRAQEPPAVQARRSAEPIEAGLGSSRHLTASESGDFKLRFSSHWGVWKSLWYHLA